MAKVDPIDTVKGNIMIAKFMGFIIEENEVVLRTWQQLDEDGINVYRDLMSVNRLTYHSDWQQLMPVVLKLEEKHVDVLIAYRNVKINWMDSDSSYETESGIQGDTKILALWTAICYFLDWVDSEEVDLDNPVYTE